MTLRNADQGESRRTGLNRLRLAGDRRYDGTAATTPATRRGMSDEVLVATAGGITVITLRRPRTKNAR